MEYTFKKKRESRDRHARGGTLTKLECAVETPAYITEDNRAHGLFNDTLTNAAVCRVESNSSNRMETLKQWDAYIATRGGGGYGGIGQENQITAKIKWNNTQRKE